MCASPVLNVYKQKTRQLRRVLFSSGGRIRIYDLRVMSLTLLLLFSI